MVRILQPFVPHQASNLPKTGSLAGRRDHPQAQQTARTAAISPTPPLALPPRGAEATHGCACTREAVVAVGDQAPGDPDARFQLAVLHAMAAAPEKQRAAQRSLVTEGSDLADEVPASLAHFASNGPVAPAPGHAADSHPRRAR
jgi:hypothetical protein